MADIFDMTDTWNNGGTQFYAIKMNVTDTASASNSRLIDLLVGGASKYSVDKTGAMVTAADATMNSITMGRGSGNVATNMAIGYFALASNTTGQGNAGVGYQALNKNAGGSFNLGLGYLAVYNNTSGAYNIGIGAETVYTNTTGSYNVGISYQALQKNVDGTYNIGIGVQALQENIGGDYNIGIGVQALGGQTDAQFNNAVGYQTAKALTTGGSNDAFGVQALGQATTGYQNCAYGLQSMYSTVGGYQNAGFGYQSLYSNVSGFRNSACGYRALFSSTYNNCAGLGYNTAVTGDNQVQLGDSATTTYAYGAVQNRSDQRDKSDIRDTVLGLDFVLALRPRDFRWDYRDDYKAQVPDPGNETPEEYQATVDAWKQENRLSEVTRDGTKKRNRYHHGLIAQEVKSVIEEMKIDFGGFQDHSRNGGEDVMSIGYNELIGPMIKAMQELAARNAALEARIATLEGA
jgi:hypothetical protein